MNWTGDKEIWFIEPCKNKKVFEFIEYYKQNYNFTLDDKSVERFKDKNKMLLPEGSAYSPAFNMGFIPYENFFIIVTHLKGSLIIVSDGTYEICSGKIDDERIRISWVHDAPLNLSRPFNVNLLRKAKLKKLE